MQLSEENVEKIAGAVMRKMQTELPVFRDARDVDSLRRKERMITFLGIGLVLTSILAGVLFLRTPTLNTIIKDATGQRVVAINDRDFGCGEPVELGKDNLTNDDKTYLANQFAKWVYGVYTPSRDKDIERALNLIADKKFLKEYSGQLVGGQLQQEKAEQWNAVWTPQKITVDPNNPMMVRIIGTQDLTKVVNNVTKKEKVQYELTFEMTSENARNDGNLRTGFKILRYNGEKLNSQSDPTA